MTLPTTKGSAMRVECYWNLHKRCFSVRALEGPDQGRVIVHAKSVVLFEPKFVVQAAGRDKVRREHKKNVHAFVRGYLMNKQFEDRIIANTETPWEVATYNPYTHETWEDTQRNTLADAGMALLQTTFDKRGQVLYV